MSRSVRVSISGFALSVRTGAKAAYVRQLARYVDQKIRELRAGGGRVATTQSLAFLAAMEIADELHQLREEKRRLEREVRDRSKRILDYLEREASA